MDSATDTNIRGDASQPALKDVTKSTSDLPAISEKIDTTYTTESQTSLSPLPALPVEVIERILKYTFLRPSKLTPTSDPFHLIGTSSLLLVSKGVRELCLPLFYKSITISRPSHYTTFFHPKDGLFAGELGRERWSLVKELSIVFGVEPPLITEFDEENEDEYLLPLEIPSNRRLDVLCLLDQGTPTPLSETEEFLQLLTSVQEDKKKRGEAVFGLTRFNFSSTHEPEEEEELRMELHKPDADEQDIINRWVRLSLIKSVRLKRKQLCGEELLNNTNPLDVRVTTELQRILGSMETSPWTSEHYGRPPAHPSDSISIYCSPAILEEGEIYLGDIFTLRVGPGDRATRLYGYPDSFLAELRSNLKIYPEDADLYMVDDWTWCLEDGTVCRIREESDTSS